MFNDVLAIFMTTILSIKLIVVYVFTRKPQNRTRCFKCNGDRYINHQLGKPSTCNYSLVVCVKQQRLGCIWMQHPASSTILLERLQEFQTHLTKRGYSIFEIQPIVHEISTTDRNELLKRQINKRKSKTIPNVMVTKYDPRIKGIKKRLIKYWPSVLKDETCRKIFKTEPIIAYSKHKNIGDIVTSSVLH